MRVLPAVLIAVLVAPSVYAQESRLASDWRREREHIAEDCGTFTAKALTSCAVTLITDYPFHIALGNLAPKNGFAFGGAFVERYTPNETWRISFSADAVSSTSKAWRAGGYATFVRSNVGLPTVTTGAATTPLGAVHQYPVFRAYVQHTALNEVLDFGPDFDNPAPRVFTEDQTIAGGSAVLPLNHRWLRVFAISAIGGLNGRFITVDNAADSDTFVETFEEVRLQPSTLADHLRLNYAARFQQFFGESAASFSRWTVDLGHEIPLYSTQRSAGRSSFNGPNECFTGPTDTTCPPLNFSRNLGGSIGVRLLATSSSPFDDGGQVPLYLQPTIGGQDINNERILASFDDYRFRAPHVIAAQLTAEHSIWGPFGGFIGLERGKATQKSSSLNFRDLLSSYSAGLSIRAGGAPVVTASWSWGSGGNRLIVTMDASLLGGSQRPRLQ